MLADPALLAPDSEPYSLLSPPPHPTFPTESRKKQEGYCGAYEYSCRYYRERPNSEHRSIAGPELEPY